MATDPAVPWRGVSIEEALDVCADDLIERGLATDERGFSAAALKAADKRLGHPMPPELRAFYGRVTPVPMCPEPEYGLVAFQPADDPDLMWLDDPDVREKKLWTAPPAGECWLEGWSDARMLTIGYTPFGDTLLWCEGLANRPAGTIVLTDHESDENPIVLGDSLAEWLVRYHAYGLVEMAIVPASLDELDAPEALAFLTDHLRLNPAPQWANEKLRKLSSP